METTRTQLLNHISAGFKQYGTDKMASIISEAIDICGPTENNHINWMHKNTAKELLKFSEMNLTDRRIIKVDH